jgi:hypothetical protein
MTSAQLELITTDRAWKLDKRTVEIGRAGLAQARAALAAATEVKEEFTAPDHGDQIAPAYIAPRYIAQTLVDDAQISHQAAA